MVERNLARGMTGLLIFVAKNRFDLANDLAAIDPLTIFAAQGLSAISRPDPATTFIDRAKVRGRAAIGRRFRTFPLLGRASRL